MPSPWSPTSAAWEWPCPKGDILDSVSRMFAHHAMEGDVGDGDCALEELDEGVGEKTELPEPCFGLAFPWYLRGTDVSRKKLLRKERKLGELKELVCNERGDIFAICRAYCGEVNLPAARNISEIGHKQQSKSFLDKPRWSRQNVQRAKRASNALPMLLLLRMIRR